MKKSEFIDNVELMDGIKTKNINIFLTTSVGNIWKNKLMEMRNLKNMWVNSLKSIFPVESSKNFIDLIFEMFKG